MWFNIGREYIHERNLGQLLSHPASLHRSPWQPAWTSAALLSGAPVQRACLAFLPHLPSDYLFARGLFWWMGRKLVVCTLGGPCISQFFCDRFCDGTEGIFQCSLTETNVTSQLSKPNGSYPNLTPLPNLIQFWAVVFHFFIERHIWSAVKLSKNRSYKSSAWIFFF